MSLQSALAGFRKGTMESIGRTRRIVVIELFSAVIESTPVLEGRLRAAWITSIGAPSYLIDPTRTEEQALAEVHAAAGALTGDDSVYFTNPMPYARRIEFEGYSQDKAPHGMVRVNVNRFVPLINHAIKRGLQ